MKLGDHVPWRSINRDYTGVIVGSYRGFALVKIDGSEKHILLGGAYIKRLNKTQTK